MLSTPREPSGPASVPGPPETGVAKPPVELELVWQGDLRFEGTSGGASLVLDANGGAGPTPVQALAFALAGCMATDVVHILAKGRYVVESLRARLRGERAEADPRRFVRIDLHFLLAGDMPDDRVERAIALSRETYCSVWHSLRPDIELTTSFERVGAGRA
jgi:putative redox protein